MQNIQIAFSDIDWGEDEARNDESLEHYFVEFPGYDSILKGKKRFIIGRKGTGKSAILQKIRLDCNSNPTLAYKTNLNMYLRGSSYYLPKLLASLYKIIRLRVVMR